MLRRAKKDIVFARNLLLLEDMADNARGKKEARGRRWRMGIVKKKKDSERTRRREPASSQDSNSPQSGRERK